MYRLPRGCRRVVPGRSNRSIPPSRNIESVRRPGSLQSATPTAAFTLAGTTSGTATDLAALVLARGLAGVTVGTSAILADLTDTATLALVRPYTMTLTATAPSGALAVVGGIAALTATTGGTGTLTATPGTGTITTATGRGVLVGV